MTLLQAHYEDEFRNVHVPGDELGRGRQGVVMRTRDADVAIKFVLEDGVLVSDAARIRDFARQIRRVRSLPIPRNLQLAVPAALLEGVAGYAMTLLQDMEPFKHLLPNANCTADIGAEDVPEWLTELHNSDAAAAAKRVHYLRTGGLRRRLSVLAKCAAILARLHAAGLVYGDLSPANAFLSSEAESCAVWLIDSDNLRFASQQPSEAFCTPRYGAPEVVQGRAGSNFATDCHAFATMAFYILSLAHPFIGKMVGGASDCATETEDIADPESRAIAGEFPWVDDSDDDSNATENGLPRMLVTTESLRSLFQSTFGPGRLDPVRRPAVFHWPEALARAEDLTVLCAACGMSYFGLDHLECPYCSSARPPVLCCEARAWPTSNEWATPVWTFLRELPAEGNEIALPRRLFEPFDLSFGAVPLLTVSAVGGDFVLKAGEEGALGLEVALPHVSKGAFQSLTPYRFSREALREGFFLYSGGAFGRLIHCRLSEGSA